MRMSPGVGHYCMAQRVKQEIGCEKVGKIKDSGKK